MAAAGEFPSFTPKRPWADVAALAGSATAWAHHGIVALDDGIVGFHTGSLVIFDLRGRRPRPAHRFDRSHRRARFVPCAGGRARSDVDRRPRLRDGHLC
jgi:hypothetical protein